MIKFFVMRHSLRAILFSAICFTLTCLSKAQNSAMEHGATARWQWELKRLADPQTGCIPNNVRQRELTFASTLPKNTDAGPVSLGNSTGWIHRGPYFIGGRTRALAIDACNTRRILAGSVSGGMWISDDAGQNWRATQATNELRSATCLVQDNRPNHQNIWIMGTGEAYGQSAGARGAYYLGDGLFISVDSGKSWKPMASTAAGNPLTFTTGWQLVWNLAIDNTASDTGTEIYAAIYNQIMRSFDQGKTWRSMINGGYFTDVAVAKSGVVFATSSSDGAKKGIFRASNDGDFVNINPPFLGITYKRISIGIDPNKSESAYFLLNTDGFGKKTINFKGEIEWNALYRYTMFKGMAYKGGDSILWEDLSVNLPNKGGYFERWNVQGSYDMLVRVTPGNSNQVFIGGTNLFKSTTGFSDSLSTSKIGGYAINAKFPNVGVYSNHHPDQHNLVFYPLGDSMLSSNDGGVFRANQLEASPQVWQSLNNGYLTTQFYTVALDHATSESPIIVAGAQDNCQVMTVSTNPQANWNNVFFGDGSYCQVADGAKTFYFSKQQGKMVKAEVDPAGIRTKYARIDPIGGAQYLFVNPYILDPKDNNVMYLAGGKYLWRNNDLKAIAMNNTNDSIAQGWFKGPDSIPIKNEFISAIGVSSFPAHRVYYGSTLKRVYRIDSANVTSLKPKDITATIFPSAYVSCVAVDPRNAERLLVAFSNYNVYSIFASDDGGKTWSKSAGNLEQYATGLGDGPSIRWLSIMPVADGTIYLAATSTGFYATDTLMGLNTKWVQQASGEIGNMVCDMFDVRILDGTVALATHGNGIFSAKLVKKGDILSVNQLEKNNSLLLTVSPNPSRSLDEVRVSWVNSQGLMLGKLQILDVLGRVLIERNLTTQEIQKSQLVLTSQGLSRSVNTLIYIRLQSNLGVRTVAIQMLD